MYNLDDLCPRHRMEMLKYHSGNHSCAKAQEKEADSVENSLELSASKITSSNDILLSHLCPRHRAQLQEKRHSNEKYRENQLQKQQLYEKQYEFYKPEAHDVKKNCSICTRQTLKVSSNSTSSNSVDDCEGNFILDVKLEHDVEQLVGQSAKSKEKNVKLKNFTEYETNNCDLKSNKIKEPLECVATNSCLPNKHGGDVENNNNSSRTTSLKRERKQYNSYLHSSNAFEDSNEELLLQREKCDVVGKRDYEGFYTNSETGSLFRSTPSPYSALSPPLRMSENMSEQHLLKVQHDISDRKPYYHYEQSVTPLLPCELPPRTCSAPIHPYDLPSQRVLPPLCESHSQSRLRNYNNINKNSNNKANTNITDNTTRTSHKYNVKSEALKNNYHFYHQNVRKEEVDTEKKSQNHLLQSDETSMFSSLLSCTRLPLAPINENECLETARLHKKKEPIRDVHMNNTIENKLPNKYKEHVTKTTENSSEKEQCTKINTNEKKCSKDVQPHSRFSKENALKALEVRKHKHKKVIEKATVVQPSALSETVSPHTESDTELKKQINPVTNLTNCESQENDGAKLNQLKPVDSEHIVTGHLTAAEDKENHHIDKEICRSSTRLSPWLSSSLQRVTHSIEFTGNYWHCLVEEHVRVVEDAAQNDIAAALGVTLSSVQEVKCFYFPAKQLEMNMSEKDNHVVRKGDAQKSNGRGSRCVVHFAVTCPDTWNKEQVYRLLDSYSFPNLWRLHDNLTCNELLARKELLNEHNHEMQALTLQETEPPLPYHLHERDESVLEGHDKNAVKAIETTITDTPFNSKLNNCITTTRLSKRREKKNVKSNRKEDIDENDNIEEGENVDSNTNNTEIGECPPSEKDEFHVKQEWQQERQKQSQQQELSECDEEEKHKFEVDPTCIVKSKSYDNDVYLQTENIVANKVNDVLVDAGNAHTPRNENDDIDSEIHNSAQSTPSHTSSYCTPTSRTHFSSLIKFASEEKARKSNSAEDVANDAEEKITKLLFKAWSPLMDGSDNEISFRVDNNNNVSYDTSFNRIVVKGHEDHSTAHRLSCQDDNHKNCVLGCKENNKHNENIDENLNKQSPNRISSSTSSSSTSPSYETNISGEFLTDADKEAFDGLSEEHFHTPSQKESTNISQRRLTESLPRHICVCVEPYSKIHMVVFFGKQWKHILQQCKANYTSVLKAFKKDMNDVIKNNLFKEHLEIHVNYITAESTSLIVRFTAICHDMEESQICCLDHDGDIFNKCSEEIESLTAHTNNSINSSVMQYTWSLYNQFAKEYEKAAEESNETCKSNTTEHASHTQQNMERRMTLISGEEVQRLTEPEVYVKFTSYDVLPRLPVTRVRVEPSIKFAKHMTLHRSFTSSNWEPLFSLVVIDEATAKECFAAETKYMLRAKDCVVQSLQFAMSENVSPAEKATGQAMTLTFLCLVEYDTIKCTREEQEKVNAYSYATLHRVVSEFYTLLCANIRTNDNHHTDRENRSSSFLSINNADRLKHNVREVSQSHSFHSHSATEPVLSPSSSALASTEQYENDIQRKATHDDMHLSFVNDNLKCAIDDNDSKNNAQGSNEKTTCNGINKDTQRVCSSHFESPYASRSHVNDLKQSISPSPLPYTKTSCRVVEKQEKQEEEWETLQLSELEHLSTTSNNEHSPDCRSGAKTIPEIDDVHKFFDSESESELLSINETKCCKECSKGEEESEEYLEDHNRVNSNRLEHQDNTLKIIPEQKETHNDIVNDNKRKEQCPILRPVETSTSSLFSESKSSASSSMNNTLSRKVYFCAKEEPLQSKETYFLEDDEVNEVSDIEELMQEDSESILSMLSSSSSSSSLLFTASEESLLLSSSSSPSELLESLLLEECLSTEELLEEFASEEYESELMEGDTDSSASMNKDSNELHIEKTTAQKFNLKQKKKPLHNSSVAKTGQANSIKDYKRVKKTRKSNDNNKKKKQKKKSNKREKNKVSENQSAAYKSNKEKRQKTDSLPNKKHDIKCIKWLRCVLHGSHWPAVERLAEQELSSALREDFMSATENLPYKFVEGWGSAHSDGLYICYALEKNKLSVANVKVKSQQKALIQKLQELELEKKVKLQGEKDLHKNKKRDENLISSNQRHRKAHDYDWSDEEVTELTNYIKAYRFPCVWEVYHKFDLNGDERFSPTMSWNLSNRIKSTQTSLSYGATLVTKKDDNVKDDVVNDEWPVHLESLQEMKTTEIMEFSFNSSSEKKENSHEQYSEQEEERKQEKEQISKKPASVHSSKESTCSKVAHDTESKCDKEVSSEHADKASEQMENRKEKSETKHTLVRETESIGSDAPQEECEKESIEVSCESNQPDKQPSTLSKELHKIVFGQAFTGQRWTSVVENDKDYLRTCFINDTANALHSYTHVSDGICANGEKPTYTIHITAVAVKESKLNVYYTVTPSNDVEAKENIVKSRKMFKEFVCDAVQSYNFPLTWALHDLHFAEQVNSPILSQSSSPTSNMTKKAVTLTAEEKEQKTLKSNKKIKELTSLHKANSYVVEPEVKQITKTASLSEKEQSSVTKSKLVNTDDEEIIANTERNTASRAAHKSKRHKVISDKNATSIHRLQSESEEGKDGDGNPKVKEHKNKSLQAEEQQIARERDVLPNEQFTETEVLYTLSAQTHEQKAIKHAIWNVHERCGSAECDDEKQLFNKASSTRHRLENALLHSTDMTSDGKPETANTTRSPLNESSVKAAKVKGNDEFHSSNNDPKVAEIHTVEEKELEQCTPVDHMSHIELQKSARKKEQCKRHGKKHTLRLAHVSKLLQQLDEVQKMAESFPNEINNAIKAIPDRLEERQNK